jgi:hypothetical protein
MKPGAHGGIMWTTVIMLAAASALASFDVAEAVVLCAHPRSDGTFNTSVKIRETCKPAETQLDPVALGLQGPPGSQGPLGPIGPAGPPGPAGASLVMKDAVGSTVGFFTGFRDASTTSPAAVLRHEADGVVLLNVDPTGIEDTSQSIGDRYLTPDCSGQRYLADYLAAFGIHTLQNGAQLPTGSLGSAEYAGDPVEYRQLGSILENNFDSSYCAGRGGTIIPGRGCCSPYPHTESVGLPQTADFTGLVSPFHVEGP